MHIVKSKAYELHNALIVQAAFKTTVTCEKPWHIKSTQAWQNTSYTWDYSTPNNFPLLFIWKLWNIETWSMWLTCSYIQVISVHCKHMTADEMNTPVGSLYVIKAFFFSGTKCMSLISPPRERLEFSKYIDSISFDMVGGTLETLMAGTECWALLITGCVVWVSDDWCGSDMHMVAPLNTAVFLCNTLAATKWTHISSNQQHTHTNESLVLN